MSAEELLRKIEQGEIVTINGKVICTGAMWYDRFEEELKSIAYNDSSYDGYYSKYALEAAKRAAGLEEHGTVKGSLPK